MRSVFLSLLPLIGCATSGTIPPGDDAGSIDGATTGPIDGPGRIEDSAAPPPEDEDEDADPVQLFINELMPANDGAVEVDGETPDWIELFNPGSDDVSLDGFTITDDLDAPRKAALPDGLVVSAEGFLVLYASGTDAGATHLPFKLSSAGESVGLYFPNGSPADRIEFGAMSDNLALARAEDGGETWAVTITPTPGAANEIE